MCARTRCIVRNYRESLRAFYGLGLDSLFRGIATVWPQLRARIGATSSKHLRYFRRLLRRTVAQLLAFSFLRAAFQKFAALDLDRGSSPTSR